MLTREFIGDRLYHPSQGYFCNPDVQVGELKKPIDFKNLLGYEDYQKALVENYPQNAWLTPCEIFKPYYGMAIANYIHQLFAYLKETNKIKQKQIKIIEAGAGTGTAAQSILFFLKNYESQYYQNIQYNICEVSPQMCKVAHQKLSVDHKKLINNGQIRIINEDIQKYDNFNKDDLHFVIFLEVLDNMPHDRVYYCDKKKDFIFQSMVEFTDQNGNENLKEIQRPITDSTIKKVLEIYKQMPEIDEIQDKQLGGGLIQKILQLYYKQNQKNLFLPTYCYKMIENINKIVPNHHVIMADFDMLRNSESALQGIYAPIVSKKGKKSHEKEDYDGYLVQRGQADIFFPTDFRLLQRMYKDVTGKKSKIFKTSEFMKEFSKDKWTLTKSGYNPLKEDFTNTSFLVTDFN